MKKQFILIALVLGISCIPFLRSDAQPQLKRYYLIVNNADNELKVFVNNTLAYQKWTENDPTFDDRVDITNFMQLSVRTGFINKIRVVGTNAGSNIQGSWPVTNWNVNSWHIRFSIVVVNQITLEKGIVYSEDIKGPSPLNPGTNAYIAFEKIYELVKEN